jgi:uncharacterized protein YxjI
MQVIGQLHPSLSHRQYFFRRRYFSYVGTFDIYDRQQNLVLHSTQKNFNVGGDFHVYSDKKEEQEIFAIVTPKNMQEGLKYTVIDGITSEPVGIIEQRGYSYLLKERWDIFSKQGGKTARLLETSTINAIFQRVVKIIPQNYLIISDNIQVAKVKKHCHPYVLKYTLRILEENPSIDIRLLISSIILLGTEGKFLVPY